MDNSPRKASEVLLALETKIDTLLSIIQAQDHNIKVLSNKLNIVMQQLEKQPAMPPKITVEAVNNATPFIPQSTATLNPERDITVSAESNLPLETEPKGFRRTSRPETFAGDNAYLPSPAPKFPVQMPKPPPGRDKPAEVIVPNKTSSPSLPVAPPAKQVSTTHNKVPVVQRIVDRNGKSVFLADIEVLAHETGESIFKTRTNGVGKWQAVLDPGGYRVMIRKRESLSKEKIEVGQDIQVDGNQSPLELQTMIIK